eukprot:746937-Amphidinium_carterae.1
MRAVYLEHMSLQCGNPTSNSCQSSSFPQQSRKDVPSKTVLKSSEHRLEPPKGCASTKIGLLFLNSFVQSRA